MCAQQSGDVVTYDCDEAYNIDDLLYTLRAQSLFASQRTIILAQVFAHAPAADQKKIIAALEQPTTDTIIITEQKVPRKNAKLFVWLLDNNADVIAHHSPITGAALDRWVRARVAHHGMTADDAAIGALAVAAGDNLQRLDNEIVKLATYVRGRTCTVADVRALVHGNVAGDMFATVEALCAQDRARALHLLHTQRASGDDAAHIFAMYAYQVRILIRVASVVEQDGATHAAAVAKTLGVHPFVAQKALPIARRFSLERLKKVHQILAAFDRDTKTGKRDRDSVLDLLVMYA